MTTNPIRQMQILPYLYEYVHKNYTNDLAHKVPHVSDVMSRSIIYANMLADIITLDHSILSVAAAFHDVGLSHGREYHEIYSAKYLIEDEFIEKNFTTYEIQTISNAILEHRSRYYGQRQSFYSRILADADNEINVYNILWRLWISEDRSSTSIPDRIQEVINEITIGYASGDIGKFELNLPYFDKINERNKNILLDDVEVKRIFFDEFNINHIEQSWI